MNASETAERLSRARQAVAELIDIVRAERRPGTEAWYRMLLDIGTTLADSAKSGERALAEAADMFDALFAGPRNFSEFYVWRPEESETLAANRRLSRVIERAAGALGAA